MSTNSSALIVPAQPAATNTAELKFEEAPKPPVAIANPWLWAGIITGALVLALAAVLLWRHHRKKKRNMPQPPLIPLHQRARYELEQALALIADPKPFSIKVSDTLRNYLEERFNFRAPDRTTEEFLCELQTTNLLTQDQKQSLAAFLTSCDLVKFAKYEPTEVELRGLYESAVRLVDETEPHPLAPEAAPRDPATAGKQ